MRKGMSGTYSVGVNVSVLVMARGRSRSDRQKGVAVGPRRVSAWKTPSPMAGVGWNVAAAKRAGAQAPRARSDEEVRMVRMVVRSQGRGFVTKEGKGQRKGDRGDEAVIR